MGPLHVRHAQHIQMCQGPSFAAVFQDFEKLRRQKYSRLVGVMRGKLGMRAKGCDRRQIHERGRGCRRGCDRDSEAA